MTTVRRKVAATAAATAVAMVVRTAMVTYSEASVGQGDRENGFTPSGSGGRAL